MDNGVELVMQHATANLQAVICVALLSFKKTLIQVSEIFEVIIRYKRKGRK